MAETVDFFFGENAAVAPRTNLHDRLADLMLTALTFALDDPGTVQLPFIDQLPFVQSTMCKHCVCNPNRILMNGRLHKRYASTSGVRFASCIGCRYLMFKKNLINDVR